MGPSKIKYRKHQRGKLPKGFATKGTNISFGKYGIMSLEPSIIKDKQIETIRMTTVRGLKGKGKFWLRIFPDQPYTSKGVEFSMGAGKGEVVGYLTKIKIGTILIEFDGITDKTAQEIFRTISYKLPVKVKLIKIN